MKNLLYRLLVAVLLLFFTNAGYSQNQNKIWYFGDHAGLDFNSGSPVPLVLGQLNTAEGCSSIADNTGALLFYTDGQKVWNKNHLVMPNGTGLLGNPSTTQSAVIIPMPGNTTKYYIFTIDDLAGDMTYSIVDMTMAAGLGDVTGVKNVLLHTVVTEKQASVIRCDGNIWVLSHQWSTNTFYADLVTPTGISPTVSSSVGTVHIGGGGVAFNSVGQMKISQQGNRIGLAIRDAGLFEVLDFDINTGAVTNPITINPGSYYTAYGVEFSPDGSKLYGGTLLGNNVFQFNLLAGSAAAVSASATMVGSSGGLTNSLQIATNGKIYVAKSNSQTSGIGSLDVINNPNALGSLCSYVNSGQALGGKLSLLGLPSLMVIPPASGTINISVAGTTTICAGQSTTLTASGAPAYTWTGGTTASTAVVTVSPTVTTTYYITGSTACGTDTDTVTVQVDQLVNVNVSGSDDSICSGQSVTLTATGSTSYQWSGGSTAASASISASPALTTTYYVTGAVNACGSDTDTMTVYVENTPNISVAGISTVCAGQNTTLSASGGTSYTWSGGSTASTASVTVSPLAATTYYVTSSSLSCGSDTDTVTVNVDTLVIINAFSSDDSICSGQSVNLTATGSVSYQWSGGSTATSSSVLVSPGLSTTYYVTGAVNACGSDTDTLVVFVQATPVLNVTGTDSLCEGQSTTLTASGATTYQWSGGSSAATSAITVSPLVSTEYIVTGYNGSCSAIDSVTVSVDTLPVVSLSGLNTICAGQSSTLTASGAASYAWTGAVTSSASSVTVSPLTTTTYSVTGSNGACSTAFTYTVQVDPAPAVSITGSTLICAGSTAGYSANASGGTSPYNYLWLNGDVTSSISISPSAANTVVGVLLTDVNGCSDTASLIVVSVPLPSAILSGSVSGCGPLSVSFLNESTNAATYLWDFGDGTTSTLQDPVHVYPDSGSYSVTLITTNAAGCSDTLLAGSYVNVFPAPVAAITTSGNVDSEHPVLTVFNGSQDGSSCMLYYGDGASDAGCGWADITHVYENEGTYTVMQIVTSANGCRDTAETTISVIYETTFFAPNAFTPNSNGNNDMFMIKGIGLNDFKLSIYDRWGEKIFESNDIMKGWDGTYKGRLVEQDVYVWKVDYTTRRIGKQQQIGRVTVVR
ncbi:MAG: hypothetical protein JWO44_1505 [Bacteroidetes bacterium]|nr:hypothetical protein [Bacteroidota bacterium]